MRINIREDSVEIEGYVNAVERNSKPLMSRVGRFVERILKGAFSRALARNDDVKILLNHDNDRVLGSQKQGNLELNEDNIGLHARAVISDADVMQKARDGDLVGWSFGFTDMEDGVETSVDTDTNLPLRKVRDLNLIEVSILDRSKTPAYDGTLVAVRNDESYQYHSEPYIEDTVTTTVVAVEEEPQERAEEDEPTKEETPVAIDYSEYEELIKEMKGV